MLLWGGSGRGVGEGLGRGWGGVGEWDGEGLPFFNTSKTLCERTHKRSGERVVCTPDLRGFPSFPWFPALN